MAKLETDGYTIITEHKIGDVFWRMSDNRPTKHIITGIKLTITDDNRINEVYTVAYEKSDGVWKDSCSTVSSDRIIYRTKEELIASL